MKEVLLAVTKKDLTLIMAGLKKKKTIRGITFFIRMI